MPKKKTSVIFAAAEASPFAKVGGLGDVIGSLPQALAAKKIAVSVILPLYRSIDAKKYHLRMLGSLTFERNGKQETVRLWRTKLPKNPVNYYFLEHRLLTTKNIYTLGAQMPSSIDPDIEKFSFYAEAAVETINQRHIPADIIHCHDWHASLIPSFVDQLAVTKKYPFTTTVFTIHNLGNQGITPRSSLPRLHVSLAEPALLEDYYDMDQEHLNLMKLGILTADRVTTVSPTYAKEILTRDYGAGLENFLIRRKKHLSGIINGIDTKLFDPARDRSITRRYTHTTWERGKLANKRALQVSLKLPVSPVPLYGLVSRLVSQKGFDILSEALERFVEHDVQIAILGSGERSIETRLTELAKRFPDKLSVITGFDLRRAQQIYAGSDFFLMPSLFEPCGLGQMIAMRYGTIPIVRATGGLKDTVAHMRTGIVFKDYSEHALSRALTQSLKLYSDTRKRTQMVAQCMRQDFSWNASAKQYLRLYTSLTS